MAGVLTLEKQDIVRIRGQAIRQVDHLLPCFQQHRGLFAVDDHAQAVFLIGMMVVQGDLERPPGQAQRHAGAGIEEEGRGPPMRPV